jgi:cysteine desulfuration protein SufE
LIRPAAKLGPVIRSDFFFRDVAGRRAYIKRMTASIQSIQDDFAFLDEWEDRYRYVIELGDSLPPFPDFARDNAHKVPGCVSQVWLLTDQDEGTDPVIRFQGDSDAHIVRGLVAIMLALFSGRRASDILATNAEAVLRSLGLDEHLTPQRANGLRSMVKRIKRDAEVALKQDA